MMNEIEKKTISRFLPPTKVFASQYGPVTYLQWCQLEQDRMNRLHADSVRIVKNEQGDIELSR